MPTARHTRWLTAACLVAGVLSAGPAGWAEGIEAITRPSKDVALSFDRPGRIARVFVQEGNVVQEGQLLVHQDDAAEQARLRQLKAQADNDVRIRAAEAQLQQRKVDFEKVQEAYEKNKAASRMELEHAKLDVLIAELSVELTRFEHAQDRLRYEEAKAAAERMQLRSPFDGRVEQVSAQEGESVDAQAPVVRVVKIDPLWIDVPAPLSRAAALSVGGPATVTFPGGQVGARNRDATRPGTPDTAAGRIIHVASVADAASDTLRVRVEVPNPAGRRAGEHVRVSFAPAAAVTDSPAGPPKAQE